MSKQGPPEGRPGSEVCCLWNHVLLSVKRSNHISLRLRVVAESESILLVPEFKAGLLQMLTPKQSVQKINTHIVL